MKLIKSILLTLVLMASTVAEAQVDSSHINLVLPGSTQGLMPFYQKWNALQRNPDHAPSVNVFHIGGSHVQAGTLSNTVRMKFTPSGDRGLLFPFRAIRTNGPTSYRFDYTGLWRGSRNVSQQPDVELGLAGAAAITSDVKASIKLHLRDEGRWDFRQLLLLGEVSDPSVKPYLITSAGDTLRPDPVLSYIGDVKEAWTFSMLRPDSVVTLCFDGLKRTIGPKVTAKTYLPLEDAHWFILRGMIPQTGHRGVTYQESGVNGASLPSWQRCTRHFDEELSLLAPDLAIFGVGINDAHMEVKDFDVEVFKENYRQLVHRIQTINPNCCFIWITNNDNAITHGRGRRARRTPNQTTPIVQKAMMELAKEFNGAVFDVFALMGGLKSSVDWQQAGLMQRDRIHFTNEGYQLIGTLLYDAIERDYHRYFPEL